MAAAADREHDAFDEQAADQPPAARAERGADAHLAAAHGRARQHQVGDVGAGDEQHQRHRSEQHQHPRPHPSDQLLVQRDDADAAARVSVSTSGYSASTAAATRFISSAACSIETPSLRRPMTRELVVAAARRGCDPTARNASGTKISVGQRAADRVREPARHHAGDLPGLVVDLDGAADRRPARRRTAAARTHGSGWRRGGARRSRRPA